MNLDYETGTNFQDSFNGGCILFSGDGSKKYF
jgi:hypothetical protein